MKAGDSREGRLAAVLVERCTTPLHRRATRAKWTYLYPMPTRLFAVIRSIAISILFVSIWTWFMPRWIAAEKGVTLKPGTGWPVVLIVLGGIIMLRCVLDFGWRGRGTPFPLDAPRQFVATGFYRWVRNPMYVGMAITLIGEALLLPPITKEMLVMLAILAVLVSLLVIFYEEPHLQELFGEDYELYRRNVPRWIPRLRPYHPAAVPNHP